MAIYYISPTGNDTTGTGTAANPFKTGNRAVIAVVDGAGDEIRLQESVTSLIGGANFTFTNNTSTIATSASMIGTIVAGDYIGKPSALIGTIETYYRVVTVTSTTITIFGSYLGSNSVETQVKKIIPESGMGLATGYHINLSKSCFVSGGWNLGTQTRSGETMIFSPGTITTSTNISLYISSTPEVEYLGVCQGYYCINVVSASSGWKLKNVSICDSERVGLLMSANSYGTLENFFGHNVRNTGFAVIHRTGSVNSELMTYNNVWVWDDTVNATVGAFRLGPNCNLPENADIYIRNSLNGFAQDANSRAYNVDIENCVTASYLGGDNCVISGFDIRECTNGTTCGSSNLSHTIEENNYFNVITGITFNRTTGVTLRKNRFENGTNHVLIDSLSGDIFGEANEHINPASWAYNTSAGAGLITLKSSTIDAPSINKAIRVIASNMFEVPQFLIQDCFGLADGAYYSNGVIIKDNTILTPLGFSSLKLAFLSSVENNRSRVPVAVLYAYNGNSYTIQYKLRADGAWTGSLIPYLYLDGQVLTTGTTITSISNGSWDTHTISTGAVPRNGELVLRFTINSNTTAISLGDVIKL